MIDIPVALKNRSQGDELLASAKADNASTETVIAIVGRIGAVDPDFDMSRELSGDALERARAVAESLRPLYT